VVLVPVNGTLQVEMLPLPLILLSSWDSTFVIQSG
jgi:hypothetical protein